MTPKMVPGRPDLLGATPDERGTNFAVASGGDEVRLCLFDADGAETQLVLPDRDGDVWHGFVPGGGAGQAYGFRVSGPFDPGRGLRYNPAKLLLDPYARSIAGDVRFGPEILGHTLENPSAPSPLDSAGHVPGSLVAAALPPLSVPKPRYPLADTIIYEVHVRGFTAAHPGVPKELRGTYAGLAHEAALQHLVDLGVTAVELLPVHRSVPEEFLVDRGLTNYWGYNTIGFFAPQANYSAKALAGQSGEEVSEFRAMVDALHGAGLEVILDVVVNHTAEGGPGGPTLCFRGLDTPAYYRLDPADAGRYVDTTGTGNSLNTGHPTTLRLIMDSLRYWLSQMGVDGFRFDLAPTLARGDGTFDPFSAFFDIVAQDPVISQAKLIAEPWDVGRMDSYEVGRFPPLWSEWNGRFRDTLRDWWRSQDGRLAEFASRLCGASDIYGDREEGRRPSASVNFVTVHDGFTLNDLVSYDQKHNEANGEGNRDGTDDNRSWNCGAEGPTEDPGVNELRARQKRNFLVTLFLSQGVPMLLAGDEMGRTQQGNNNAYCQDNTISWVDWSQAAAEQEMLQFTETLAGLRRDHPVFRRRRFFRGQVPGAGKGDIVWLTPAGEVMTDADWEASYAKSLAAFLNGDAISEPDPRGGKITDASFLLLFNAHSKPLTFTLPEASYAAGWEVAIETASGVRGATPPPRKDIEVRDRTVVVLRSTA